MQEAFDPPTAAEQVAGMISGTATIRAKSVVRPVLVRIPLNQLMTIDAMCDLAGKSRSQMVVNLLEVGIDSVSEKLRPDAVDRLNEAVIRISKDLVSDSSNETDEEVA